ncbi:MAG: AfsA-related hotdog domain-containing protein [Frankia sp.]
MPARSAGGCMPISISTVPAEDSPNGRGVAGLPAEVPTQTSARPHTEHTAELREPFSRRPLSYQRTLDRALVHRRSVSEVLLTDAHKVDPDTFAVAAHLPDNHLFYSDLAGRDSGAPDPLLLAEIIRQTGIATAHLFYGVPRDWSFIFHAMELDARRLRPAVTRPDGEKGDVRAGGDAGQRDHLYELHVDVGVRDLFRRRGQLGGYTLDLVFTCGGDTVARATARQSFVPRPTWRALRSRRRDRPVAHHRPSAPASATAVGRRDISNVVVNMPFQSEAGPACILIIDQRHRTLFDHPLDHVPGMLSIEAARQAAVLLGARPSVGPGPPDLRFAWMSAEFDGFLELDVPVAVHVAAPGPDRPQLWRAEFRHLGDPAVLGRVGVSW